MISSGLVHGCILIVVEADGHSVLSWTEGMVLVTSIWTVGVCVLADVVMTVFSLMSSSRGVADIRALLWAVECICECTLLP